ncbi:single-stranded DNA-binding protein [Mycoplasma mycoides]|uniref:single-stranded DNA-binding protein n=1 Tax=Mycoplasma mycoides TaxID=2102 RepID=UPI00223FEDA0|nr:single-stranded DNA-binding protein [Mycoplasma mycoides]QVJ95999.1 single-stranded DNA-binding protein [Mycoplasma mycoides subsp. capri]QVJ96893.1 single-stranded DNA-binding protein [Mycoplasma mycoides subsp. capri]QVK00756.1 single-stranded DNA-binding protein [Mycoplasma mycoides subsp. capri]
MNVVNIVGQIEGDATVTYTSKDGEKKLYKFIVKVPNQHSSDENSFDYINIKAWSNTVDDEFLLQDQAAVGIEGKIQSFTSNNDLTNIRNEIYAKRILYLD